MNAVWWFLGNLDTASPQDPALCLLGLYPNELKTGVQTQTWTSVFIASLFTVLKSAKNPNVHQMMNR